MRALHRIATLLRALTPLGWVVGLGAVLVGASLVLGGLGLRWDPFDLSRRRADRAEEAAAQARTAALARAAEARGQADQLVRLQAVHDAARSRDRVTTHYIQEARTADDADLLLAPDRVDRLRDHDRELCLGAPDLIGCAAAPDPAGTGDPAL